MARETQKDKIERLEKEIEQWRELCSKLNKEISSMKEKAEIDFENSPTFIQYTKRIELLEGQNEAYRLSVEHEKKMRKALVDNYEPEIKRLNEEVQKLKNENREKIHNERGAGRKSRFTEQEKESIRMYRLQGKTIKEIAEMFSCSVGIIHKLIHEK
ncbi:sigma factor-like helix-turn-helix DNA-binding protein [uncultured Clostridium sp.]|uniref:sigma factor-like helix-turn-helix DNA-binding protein n=1 Tax=uncultured Clostridium sp. TaxID=59620 RepID=UPI0025F71357|nr:sigma factor-like helix-turn-helix DNA-binding protein [uncultured Clostridium sp.]